MSKNLTQASLNELAYSMYDRARRALTLKDITGRERAVCLYLLKCSGEFGNEKAGVLYGEQVGFVNEIIF